MSYYTAVSGEVVTSSPVPEEIWHNVLNTFSPEEERLDESGNYHYLIAGEYNYFNREFEDYDCRVSTIPSVVEADLRCEGEVDEHYLLTCKNGNWKRIEGRLVFGETDSIRSFLSESPENLYNTMLALSDLADNYLVTKRRKMSDNTKEDFEKIVDGIGGIISELDQKDFSKIIGGRGDCKLER